VRTSAPKLEALRGALEPFRRVVFHARVRGHPDPSDAAGSLCYEGRYNTSGLFSVLNCSLDLWVAGSGCWNIIFNHEGNRRASLLTEEKHQSEGEALVLPEIN
jgi:hypothetical protein